MVTAVLFDTHAVVKQLKDSGFEEKQAEALTNVFKEAQDTTLKELVTKGDLKDAIHELKDESNALRYELLLIKWVLGFVFAGIISLVLKSFFIS